MDIAAFLSSLGAGEPRGELAGGAAGGPAPPDPALAARGRELFAERGCGACHEAPGAAPGSPGARAAALAAESFRDAGRGCLAGAASEERPQVPRYVLSAPDARVLAVRFGARPREPSRLAPAEAASRWVREELGCLRCHGRDGAGGAGTAPDLSGAGARLDPTWVRDALGGKAPVARPWLATRMPVFALEAGEVDAIAEALAAEDRGLEAARPAFAEPPPEPPAAELREAGLRLLGPDGLNCQSCHFIGPQRPLADTVGPDLALAAQRLERLWFERWLEEPRRFRPETPMPAFTTPVPGVFGGSIARQRAALWDFLAATPAQDIALAKAAERRLEPQGGPLFVQARVRGAGAVRADRGIALALPPAPSLLFDAGRLSWLGAWRGSFLRRAGQHGAHAWWEPASAPLGEDAARLPPVLFRSAGEPGTGLRGPALHRGRFGWFDGIAHESGGVRLRYRLRLAGGSFLRVEEALRAAEGGGRSRRLERDVTIAGVAGGEGSSGAGGVSPAMEIGPEVLVLALPELFGLVGAPAEADLLASGAPVSGAPVLRFARGALRADASGAAARWALLRGPASFPVVEPFTDEAIPPGAAFPPESAEAGGRIAVALRAEEALRGGPLRLSVELDGLVGEGAAAPATVPARAGPPPAALEARGGAVGGVALPEGYSIEALRLDPTFLPCAVAFLRGELLVAGYDGEVRRAADTNADGLQDSYLPFAGPFDQACSLLARGEELIVAAPGAAYAVRDRDGDAVADDYRTLSSAWDWAGHPFDWLFGFGAGSDGSLYGSNSTPHERGQVPGAWRRGAVIRIAPDGTTTEVAKGMRYEFGWTTDSGGRCYFTVNQGPWNVTCAIHELEVGAHYGFGEPDLSRVKAPVVRVPYPWCHALTGIVAAETGGRFGAFEGQGIAADYNTRRLIRWTVQDAGGTRQGACYPFVDGLEAGPTGLAFGPDGALYVAWMADGAWYPERPRGGVYRIAARGGAAPPFEVLEVRAARDGFEVRLTAPVDAATVAGSCRKVHRYFHEYRGGYASPEVLHEDVPVASVEASGDGRSLALRLERPHAAPRIYRLELRGLRDASGRKLATGEVYVTVHAVPGE
ncbi:MAG: hypothetical protein HY721_08165 [Planctomycetes bacterium]|nr:hypothetical protein [Planctomycetota bacterium]